MYNIAKGFLGGYLGTLRWPKRIRPHHFAIPFNYFVFIMWLKPMEFCLVTKMCSCFEKWSLLSFLHTDEKNRQGKQPTMCFCFLPRLFCLLLSHWRQVVKKSISLRRLSWGRIKEPPGARPRWKVPQTAHIWGEKWEPMNQVPAIFLLE